jgi:hypothetical protein
MLAAAAALVAPMLEMSQELAVAAMRAELCQPLVVLSVIPSSPLMVPQAAQAALSAAQVESQLVRAVALALSGRWQSSFHP